MPPERPFPEMKIWAARQLDLAPDAAPTVVRAAFLRRLVEENFVPSWRKQQAALYLAQPAEEAARRVTRQGHVQQDEEARLGEDVDDFAASYFHLDVPARQRRFRELAVESAFSPVLTFRLRALAPGLDVVPVKLTDQEDVDRLAGEFCELFLLRPESRTRQRQAMLREFQGDPRRWQAAARTLRDRTPSIARLLPGLVGELCDLEQRLVQRRNTSFRPPIGPILLQKGPVRPGPASSQVNPRHLLLAVAVAAALFGFALFTEKFDGSRNRSVPGTKSPLGRFADDLDAVQEEQRQKTDKRLKYQQGTNRAGANKDRGSRD